MITALSTKVFNTGDQHADGDQAPVITILPSILTYGVVASGFYYNLKFTLQNNALTPIRVKLVCTPFEGEKNQIRLVNLPDKIAPGMSTPITIELAAEHPGISVFNIRITQNIDSTVYNKLIEANIVTQETFKYVKKSLQLQKRPIHKPIVTTLSAISGFMNDSASIATPTTTFSEALIMDDEDLDDLLDYPRSSNVYWDPFDKCLRIDPDLGKVIVDPQITLEESIERTNEMTKKRDFELEEQGFLTNKTFQRLRDGRDNNISASQIMRRSPSPPPVDEEAGEEEDAFGSQMGSYSSSQSRLHSVSSLLAMKRDRIEKQRRMTVTASSEFAKKSLSDPMVNSMRTFNMIQLRTSSAGNPNI